MNKDLNHCYSEKEERLNIATHASGLLFSLIALPFLIIKSFDYEGFWKSASLVVYGLSMIILYAASTFYHSAKEAKLRRKLNIFDHAAIYVLIAGTYTPFTLIVLGGSLGWVIFSLTWSFNFGVSKAKTEYIAFLDADDYWYPNHLENINSLIEKFSNGEWFATAYDKRFHENFKSNMNSPILKKGDHWLGIVNDFFKNSLIDCLAWTSAVCMKKDFFESLDGFDLTFHFA